MKFNCSTLLFITAVIAQAQVEPEETECYTKLDCKLRDIFKNIKSNSDFNQCTSFKDEEAIYKCVYKVAGLKESQINVLTKLLPDYEKCSESSKPQLEECISKCSDKQACKESCTDEGDEKSAECFAKQLNIKDFDVKKSVQCTKECTQDTLSEIFDCDRKCREPFYKKFENDAKDSKSNNSTDSKSNKDKSSNTSTSNQSDSKDPKPTNGSSTQQSNGFYNLQAGLLTTITFPILFSLFL